MPQDIPISLSENKAVSGIKKRNLLSLFIVSMRPYQWTKNLFIFAPLLFGRKLNDPTALVYSLLTFVTFCFLASSLYIFNDWIDMDEDRAHPEKCQRPISSGALSASIALFGAAILAVLAFGIVYFISLNLFLISLLYFILTLSYCLILKRIIVLDGMTIASGFVLRVVGGAVAIGVMPTHWLIVCTFLLALFLAFTKRRQELLTLSNNAAEHREVLGQYTVSYLDQVNTILIGAAIVCYALYTVAPETIERFGTDKLIYGTVFVIYGMLRYLALIRDSSKGGNPSKMLLQDKPLLLTLIGWAIYNGLFIYHLTIEDVWELFVK